MNELMVRAPSGVDYPVYRCGSGTPLLLLHGFTGSHASWQHLVNRLPAGHLITTLDLPGHGKSVLPNSQSWTFGAVVDDLAWIIATQLGGNAIVLGYSMGGRLALALTASYPERVRALILESASPGIADEQEQLSRRLADERLANRIERDGLAAFVAEWERLPMWESQVALPEVDLVRQQNIRLSHTATGLAANLRSTGTGAQPSFWEQLPDLKTWTLLIAGELDHKFAGIAARMHEVLPDSRLEIISDAGHAVHLEQPERYVQAVSQFAWQPALNAP